MSAFGRRLHDLTHRASAAGISRPRRDIDSSTRGGPRQQQALVRWPARGQRIAGGAAP
jgi:hypothetical protein